jgi:hypothetical protein
VLQLEAMGFGAEVAAAALVSCGGQIDDVSACGTKRAAWGEVFFRSVADIAERCGFRPSHNPFVSLAADAAVLLLLQAVNLLLGGGGDDDDDGPPPLMDPDDDVEDASARAPARDIFWHCKVGLFLGRHAPPRFLVKPITTCTPRFWNEFQFEVLRAHTGRHLFLCFFSSRHSQRCSAQSGYTSDQCSYCGCPRI